MSNDKNPNLGFDQSDVQTATIAQDAATSDTVDLGRPYETVRISIPDCDNIPNTTTMSFAVDVDGEGSLFNLWNENGQAAIATGNLPTDTTAVTFIVRDAIGIRRIALTLSNNATGGDVIVNVQGINGGIERSP